MASQIFKRLTTLSLVATFSLFAAVASANAQASNTNRVTIPFDFFVRNKNLPAGEYIVGRFQSSNTTTLLIRGVSTPSILVFQTHHVSAADPGGESKFVFRKYGDRYFLAQIWSAGERDGNELPVTSSERTLRRHVAGQPTKDRMSRKAPEPETVTIVARSR
jgi:hypothetical protein